VIHRNQIRWVSMRFRAAMGIVLCAFLLAGTASAQAPQEQPILLDRVVVRWHAPETGGVDRPQFIFERELAFEARLEALSDPDSEPGAYSDRHVRAALERHIAESLLASLPIVPEPKPQEVAAVAEGARAVLVQRVKGWGRLNEAATAEGIGTDELDAMLRRQARASLYLDRMVAPLLSPSEAELRALHKTEQNPYSREPFDKIAPDLERWVKAQRLGQAFKTYFQNAETRIVLTLVQPR